MSGRAVLPAARKTAACAKRCQKFTRVPKYNILGCTHVLGNP
jgi:hypothetical protein